MTEQEFLQKVSYSTNTEKENLTVWYDNQILAELDFSFEPKLLDDKEYCEELSARVALESSYSSLITQN